jgi:hypothetical protein
MKFRCCFAFAERGSLRRCEEAADVDAFRSLSRRALPLGTSHQVDQLGLLAALADQPLIRRRQRRVP